MSTRKTPKKKSPGPATRSSPRKSAKKTATLTEDPVSVETPKPINGETPKRGTPTKTPKTPVSDKSSKRKSKRKSLSEPDASPSKPSVEVSVHRLRNLNFHPKPVLCIRPVTIGVGKERDTKIALSRTNGSIELLSARQKLRSIATVAGASEKPTSVLAWVCDKQKTTLVGASRDGTIYVVDFAQGRVRSVTPSAGGGIFALATACGKKNCCSKTCVNIVATGCEDGSVRFFQMPKNDAQQMQVVSSIPSAGAAVLSLAWVRFNGQKGKTNGTHSSSSLVGSTIFAGVADGTIRRYDCLAGGTWKSSLRMTVESLGRNTPPRVWTLQALKDGTVVSGDSLGHVQFWDGHTGTMLYSFDQNDNKADVLSLDITQDQRKVFASGVDSRVVCIECVVPPDQERRPGESLASNVPKRWVLTSAQRPHTHDVQAVATYLYPKKKGFKELVCTGGLDTKLCTYTVNEFQRQRPHTRYPWPSKSPISVAPKARLLSMMREDRIHLYKLAPRVESHVTDPLMVNESNVLVGTVELQSPLNLSASTISKDGRFLAVSNVSTMLLFALNYSSDDDESTVSPVRIPLKLPSSTAVMSMKFGMNNRLFLATSSGDLLVVSIEDNGEVMATIVQTINSPESGRDEVKPITLPVNAIEVSDDGEWLATVRNSSFQDDSIQIFREDEGTGTYFKWWSVPELDRPHAAVSFLPGNEPQLAVACVDFSPYVFNLEDRALSLWSESAGVPSSMSLPNELVSRTDYPVRIGTNPSKPGQFMVVRTGSLCVPSSREIIPQCKGRLALVCGLWVVVFARSAFPISPAR